MLLNFTIENIVLVRDKPASTRTIAMYLYMYGIHLHRRIHFT